MLSQDNYINAQFRQVSDTVLKVAYRMYYARLFKSANRFVANRHEAEDIVAEAFIRLWELRDRFNSMQNIKAFLYIYVRNHCINALNTQKRRSGILNKLFRPVPVEVFIFDEVSAELVVRVQREVSKLPPDQQAVMNLIFQEGVSVKEAAVRLNKSPKTIQNLKYLAIATLREAGLNGRFASI